MKGVWKNKFGFLKFILNEKNCYRWMEKLVYVKKDDINVVSELVVNLFKKNIFVF